MREILFRGKRTDNSKWVDGYLRFVYVDVPQKASIYSPKYVRSFDVISETVGQYTGLTDKNGVKIFEGDIIQNIANGFFGIVRWYDEHAAFVIHGINDNKTYWLFDNDFSKVRIVDNIYDEKLEVENGKISKANSN